MMKPLTTGQKIIAYASLITVFGFTVFGLFVIWIYVTEVYLK